MKLLGWVVVVGMCFSSGVFHQRAEAADEPYDGDANAADCEEALVNAQFDFRRLGETVGDPIRALIKIKSEVAFLSSLQKAQQNSPYLGAFEESLSLLRDTIRIAFAQSEQWLTVMTEVEDALHGRNGSDFEVMQRGGKTMVLIHTEKSALKTDVVIPLMGDFTTKLRSEIRVAAIGRFMEALAPAVATEAVLRSLNSSMKEEKAGTMTLAQLFTSANKLLSGDAILPLDNMENAIRFNHELLQQDAHLHSLTEIATEFNEMSQALSNAIQNGVSGTSVLNKLTLIHGMAFRVLPTIQDLRRQSAVFSLIAEDFSDLELTRLHSFKLINRYATNLETFMTHILLRVSTLSAERDERYLMAGLHALSAVLKNAADLNAGAAPVFDVQCSRHYVKAFSDYWQRHYGENVPAHHIGLEQMIQTMVAIETVRLSGATEVILNRLEGDGQIIAKMHYSDGTQVEILRRGTGLREFIAHGSQVLNQGQPYRIAGTVGADQILVDTYEELHDKIQVVQRSLPAGLLFTHQFSRSQNAGAEIDAFSRNGAAQHVLELRQNALNNRSN